MLLISDTVKNLIFDKAKLKEMSENAKKLAITDGTKRICDIVAELAKK